jgi:hypothetical protein
MRAEVTAAVRQEQVQYQTSELLIGAIAHGYRIAERPVVMRRRTSGVSKKGGNASTACATRASSSGRGGASAARGARPAAAVSRRMPRRRAVLPALRVAGFVVALRHRVAMASSPRATCPLRDVRWWLLVPAAAAALAWWMRLARGWALLVARATSRRHDLAGGPRTRGACATSRAASGPRRRGS